MRLTGSDGLEMWVSLWIEVWFVLGEKRHEPTRTKQLIINGKPCLNLTDVSDASGYLLRLLLHL